MIVFTHIEYNGGLSITQIKVGKIPVFKTFAQNNNGVEIEFSSPELKVGTDTTLSSKVRRQIIVDAALGG